jgi:transposase-like protein
VLRQLPRPQEGHLGAAPDLRAANSDQAPVERKRFDGDWGQRYPATVRAWRDALEHVTPFLPLPEELPT